MMPAVTVCCSPNGEPIASTQSPTFIRVGVAEAWRRERARRPASLSTARSVFLSTPDELGLVLLAVGGDDLDLGGPLDHVGVGEHDARRVDDDAGAQAALRLLALGRVAEEARKNSSPKNSSTGVRPAPPAVTVLMLTTAGLTFSATWAKLPEGSGSAAGHDARLHAGRRRRGGAGRPGGRLTSTAPAPQVPRPAPTTRVTRTMNADVLRLTRSSSSPPRGLPGQELPEPVALQRLPLLELGGGRRSSTAFLAVRRSRTRS